MPYHEYSGNGTAIREYYFVTSDGVALKVIDFIPPGNAPGRPVVVFVAGWISHISGWREVLKEITARYRTLYLETREKISARLPAETAVDFSIGRMRMDLDEFVRSEVPADHPFCFVGSSLGSTVILEYLAENSRKPLDAYLIAPNCEFRFPLWFVTAVLILPLSLYPFMKSILKWYLRNFRLDKRREPEQVSKYEGTIDAAEPKRLKASALALRGYSLWHKLPEISTPVMVIAAKTDILHSVSEIQTMVDLMPHGRLETMASNRETHSRQAGLFIVDRFADHCYEEQDIPVVIDQEMP
ncbi:MAG TPA: hypothetical protein ENO00_04835 [Deltaproteobacteria bacterium]|nr:hypothetical protein [Deltaproteobacteria bacterium]